MKVARYKRNRKSRIRSTRRYRKFTWIFGTSALVIGLLYWEQIAALFVISVLAMCALLLVVAFSNLEARDKELHRAALKEMGAADDSKTHYASSKKRVA